jgi:hypothetical protein
LPKPHKVAEEWKKPLSNAVKAEVLAATFHLLTDHMPKIWKKVPAFLRGQIKQAMMDCDVEYKTFTKTDLKRCVEYCQWLNEKYPQPGSTLDTLLRKNARKAANTRSVPRSRLR